MPPGHIHPRSLPLGRFGTLRTTPPRLTLPCPVLSTLRPTPPGPARLAEHALFVTGLRVHGRDWKQIAAMIPSRTVIQIRTHAQKYFQKLAKCNMTLTDDGDIVEAGPGNRVRVPRGGGGVPPRARASQLACGRVRKGAD